MAQKASALVASRLAAGEVVVSRSVAGLVVLRYHVLVVVELLFSNNNYCCSPWTALLAFRLDGLLTFAKSEHSVEMER